MKLAARALRIEESATLRVSRKAKELQAQGIEVLDLSAGEPDFCSPGPAVEAARRALAEGMTRYTANAGIPELRSALAERYRADYGAPWEAAQVVVTVGGKAALLELALALVDDGDEVVLPTPAWVSLPEQIRLAGGQPVLVPADPADRFRLRAEPLLAAIGPRTVGVLVNSPCNPTGGTLGAEDLRRIVEHCAERGLWVLADETYERFVYDGASHASAAALAAEFPETVILVSSFSKTYAMTGWRVGYVMGPRTVIAAVSNIQSHATSNATSFAMAGALEALRRGEADVQRMLDEFKARRKLLVHGLAAIPGVQCEPPDGAFYAFPRVADHYREGRRGSVEMCEYLLERARLAVVPGAAFGNDDHVRLSFACSRETLEAALEHLAQALA
jgi:aspartate aminotransferase